MRLAVIDYDLCDPNKTNFACQRFCPVNRKGEECIRIEERIIDGVKRKVPVIDENLCIGCGICVKKCNQKAISIVNTPESLEEDPIHRFGKNSFALFRLPIPIKGVVGLLGPNGVGKSTALKILSGELKPNLGKDDAQWEEIIKLHRGNELQSYLEKLSENQIKTVYKPQQITMLRNMDQETVEKEIEKIPKEIIEKLELENCINRNVKDLSGGELQRIAIAIAASKEADIYYFDEPSSYLDVKQRMNMAKLIRELSEKAPVMVVEHDLATLDFLADRIHLFYGYPSVFGVVSKPYSTLNGINTFLNGFIKEDNVKIRQPTVFEKSILERSNTKKEKLVEFTDIKKKLGNFSLHVKQGTIYQNDVLGIFGANGLGKTTFAKILSGIIESDEGSVENIEISFKPQYLNSETDETVLDILKTVANPFSQEFKQKYTMPLSLDKLMEKKVNTLSGGELQRVAIALCLARKADLYLLDEPSAYLDVDQRMAIARVLREKASQSSVTVIDHDLLFLSYLSDRAMVFSGEPGKQGYAEIMELKKGFNKFLSEIKVTFREDPETHRPRANKRDSQKDTKQKEQGKYFMSN